MISSAALSRESFVNRPQRANARSVAEEFMSTALQGGAYQNQESIRNVAGQYVAPFAHQHGEGAATVSHYESSGTISERAKRALERRLRPHTTLSAYELAYTLRISESTIWAILSGNSKTGPSGWVLQFLVEFFGATFLQEVFGGPNVHCIDPRDEQKAAALRKMIEAQEELRRLG